MTSDIAARNITLDALRGFAVMGILAMNIVAFAMPDTAYITPLASVPQTASDPLSWLVSFVLIDGKMRGLFSLLFGASMLLIIERAGAKGEDPARVHYRRMAWLAVFGLVHFFFIWSGDILFLYAVIGSIAFLAHQWEPRRLIKWALGLYLFGTVLWAMVYGAMLFLEVTASAPGADAALVKAYQGMMDSPYMSIDGTEYLAIYQGGYGGILAHRVGEWDAPLTLVMQGITETLPLMWLGMALFKTGFLTGILDSAVYRRWAWRLVPAGLILTLIAGLVVWQLGLGPIAALNGMFAWTIIPRLMLTLGYAALLVLAVRALAGSGLIARVAATGQAAITNYLGTSIIMTMLFYGYGMGLYASINRTALWLFVLGAWAVMLLWSKPWLNRFRYGPLEWLWRSLARGAFQPMQR